MASVLPGEFDHPAWLTAVGTVVAYGVVLAVIFVLFFVVPWLAFQALG